MTKPDTKEWRQGRELIAHLRRAPHTYGEMQWLGISTSPQKRVAECLGENEEVIRAKNADGLITWRVVSKWG